MKTLGLAVTMIISAIIVVATLSYCLDYLDARRKKKRIWSDHDHRLLAQSITFMK